MGCKAENTQHTQQLLTAAHEGEMLELIINKQQGRLASLLTVYCLELARDNFS